MESVHAVTITNKQLDCHAIMNTPPPSSSDRKQHGLVPLNKRGTLVNSSSDTYNLLKVFFLNRRNQQPHAR